MDLEPGTPVFLEELARAPAEHVGKTLRVTGTLLVYIPSVDRLTLGDGKYLLVVDTQLLGVQRYHVGQTYQLIGVVSGAPADDAEQDVAAGAELPEDAQYAREIVLRAHVAKDVDGLDMVIYRKAVHALRQFLDCQQQQEPDQQRQPPADQH